MPGEVRANPVSLRQIKKEYKTALKELRAESKKAEISIDSLRGRNLTSFKSKQTKIIKEVNALALRYEKALEQEKDRWQKKSTEEQLADLKKVKSSQLKEAKDVISHEKRIAKLQKKHIKEVRGEERSARLSALKEKVAGEKSAFAAIKSGGQAAAFAGEGAAGGAGMLRMAAQGGPVAIGIAIILYLIKSVIDKNREFISAVDSVQMAIGKAGGATGNTTADLQSRINDLSRSWTESSSDFLKSAQSVAMASGKSLDTVTTKIDSSGNTLTDFSKAWGIAFGQEPASMAEFMAQEMKNFSAATYRTAQSGADLATAMAPIQESLLNIQNSASNLMRTSGQMFNSVRDLNTQFSYLGDQTENFLVLSKALSGTKLPDFMREETVRGVISGFDQMASGMKVLLGEAAGGAKGIGGFFSFRKMMQGPGGITKAVEAYRGVLKKQGLAPSEETLSKVLETAGQATQQEQSQVYAAMQSIQQQTNLGQEQSLALLQMIAKEGDISKQAADFDAAMNNNTQANTESIMKDAKNISEYSKDILSYIMTVVQGWFDELISGINTLVNFFRSDEEAAYVKWQQAGSPAERVTRGKGGPGYAKDLAKIMWSQRNAGMNEVQRKQMEQAQVFAYAGETWDETLKNLQSRYGSGIAPERMAEQVERWKTAYQAPGATTGLTVKMGDVMAVPGLTEDQKEDLKTILSDIIQKGEVSQVPQRRR